MLPDESIHYHKDNTPNVLILVVMEDAPRRYMLCFNTVVRQVLILVVMEDAPRP